LPALIAAGADATAQSRDPVRAETEPLATVLRLPFSIESAAVVGGARQLRGTDVGMATWRALLDAELIGADTLDAWAALARSLRMEPEAAFDRLLGRSATVVARGHGPDQRTDWVLSCEIDDDTRRRMLDSLRPAARGVGDASNALTVEGGRIELAVGTSVNRGAGERTAPLILAPFASRPLFDEVRASLVSGGIPGEPLSGNESPHVTIIWSDQFTSAWAELRAVPTTTGWALVSRSYPHPSLREEWVWSEPAARAWMGLDDDPVALCWVSTAAGPDVPIPDRFRPLADDLIAALRIPSALIDRLATHQALRLTRQGSNISVSLLLRGEDGSRFPEIFERWVRSLLDTGRSEPLSPDEQAAGLALLSDHAGSAAERVFGPGHALRWFMLTAPDGSAWAFIDARPYRADAGDREGLSLRRRAAEVLAAQARSGPDRSIAALGQARPWELTQAMGVRDGPLVALRWIRRIEVTVPAGRVVHDRTSLEAHWTIDLDLSRLTPNAK
jgi:hypothetical protein